MLYLKVVIFGQKAKVPPKLRGVLWSQLKSISAVLATAETAAVFVP